MAQPRPAGADVVPPPSGEQRAIVAAILDGKNVRCDSVAGSGKTTTCLHVAHALPAGKTALLLTYNARLKQETRERVERAGLRAKLEAHSYHAAGDKDYDHGCFQDAALRSVVERDAPPLCPLPAWDLVIVDECQDVTETLFLFACKLLRDVVAAGAPWPQLLIIGDVMQVRGEPPGHHTSRRGGLAGRL
jgi:superfamily II DNA or RNA helicase